MSKGFLIDSLTNKRVTDDDSVINFLNSNTGRAYTIDLLINEYKFSSNIRKVLNRLENKGLIQKTSIKSENRWEYAYYLDSPIQPQFCLKKNHEIGGWELEKIIINSKEIDFNISLHDESGISIEFWSNLPESVDAAVYYHEEDVDEPDKEYLRCIRLSDLEDDLDNPKTISLWFKDLNELNFSSPFDEWRLEYDSDDRTERISNTKRKVTSDNFNLYYGPLNIQISIKDNKRIISIDCLVLNDVGHFDYVYEGAFIDEVELGWSDDDQSGEETVNNVIKVILNY